MPAVRKAIISLIFIFVAGCSTTQKDVKGGKIIVQPERSEIIWESEKPAPEWVFTPSKLPDRKEGFEYFFGVSGSFANERDARDDAFVNSVKEAVRFTGVNMKIDREQIITTLQRAGEVLNPLIAGKQKELSASEAFIKGMKPVKWYIIKKGNYLGDTFQGSFFEARVAVEVPLKIIEEAILENKRAMDEKQKQAAETLNDIAAKLVDSLALNLKEPVQGKSSLSIAIGNFKYGETGCSGAFIEDFKNLVEGRATNHKSFQVIGKVKIKNMLDKSNPNLEIDQAKNMKAGILHANYSDTENRVNVTAYITDEKGRLSSATVYIDNEKIHKEIVAKGCNENSSIISAIEPIPKQDFDFMVWTDNINGGTYKKGDTIEINVQSSERCHVKMFNIDEKGAVTVIEDTKAERILKNQKRNFKVKAMRPGVETIIAIASQSRFSEDSAINENLSGDVFSEIYKNLRNVKGKKAEYKTTLTIIE